MSHGRAEIGDGVDVLAGIFHLQHSIVLLEGVPVIEQHHHGLQAIQFARAFERVFVPIPVGAALDVLAARLEASADN